MTEDRALRSCITLSSPAQRRSTGRTACACCITAVMALLPGGIAFAAQAFEGQVRPAATERSDASAKDDASQENEDPRQAIERIFRDPLGGVVVNRTVTVLGKDFYQYFSTRWRQHDEAARYAISIHERPTARFGSEIWVQYRQQRMFHAFLPPARAATRPISEAAVEQVLRNISQRELERLTTRNPDLGPEEL